MPHIEMRPERPDHMDWIKATISTTTPGTEIITALLTDLGINGVEINDPNEREEFFEKGIGSWDYVDESLTSHPAPGKDSEARVIFYLSTGPESRSLLAKINGLLATLKSTRHQEPMGALSLSHETVSDQDWLHEWKKHFRPFTVGRVLIVPEWEAGKHAGDIVFTIDPGSAFGTGQHATTMLCIQALEKHVRPESVVLDLGCGSGILSIISLLLGAKHVVACDIDPAAVEVTKKNAILNPINQSDLHVFTGDIISCSDLQAKISKAHIHGYCIIAANIVADVLIKLAPLVKNFLAPHGVFIGSGIITERLDEVMATLLANNLQLVTTTCQDGWHCVVAHG